MNAVHLDFETTSLSDITEVGGYRYACDPSTRILMFAVADETCEPLLWRFDAPDSDESRKARALLSIAISEGWLVYAHNYQFELAVAHHRLLEDVGAEPPAHGNYRCTQAMCRRAAIPEGLGKAAEFMKLSQQKENVGKALIKIFSDQNVIVALEPPLGMIDPASQKPLKNGSMTKGKKPPNRKSSSPILDSPVLWHWRVKVPEHGSMTVRDTWEMFCEYCRQDTRTERELHAKLKRFELKGDELASFQFDMRMNFRGAPFNVPALAHAHSLITSYQERLEARMLNMCGLRSGQREKLQNWLIERGYPEKNLQADTVDMVLTKSPEKLTPLALEVLKHRALLSFAAIKKLPVMLSAACPDGRIRGTKTWHGARTGRGTSKLVQMDNMKKSTIGMLHSALAYRMICEGWPMTDFEELWDSPLEAMASCCRHFVQLPEGELMLDADFIGVEARIAPWFCGQDDKLESILAGMDQYKVMAAEVVYNIPYDQVTKAQRTVGKPVELQLGYGTGGAGLRNSLRDLHGVSLELKQCNAIVKKFREKFPKYKECWDEIEEAVKKVIRNPQVGEIAVAGGKVTFRCGRTGGVQFLVMKLPSGREMFYPRPEIKAVFKKYEEEEMVEDPWKYEKGGYWSDSVSFYGRHEGVWMRIHTWGSRLFENICQAIGADLLNYGMICAEQAGYGIFMCVHDQALAESNGLSLEGYVKALCQKQPWAGSFPLEADSSWVPFYLKDD